MPSLSEALRRDIEHRAKLKRIHFQDLQEHDARVFGPRPEHDIYFKKTKPQQKLESSIEYVPRREFIGPAPEKIKYGPKMLRPHASILEAQLIELWDKSEPAQKALTSFARKILLPGKFGANPGLIDPGPKSKKGIKEKVVIRKVDPIDMTDIARCTLKFDHLSDLLAAYYAILDTQEFWAGGYVKNRFMIDKAGYVDRSITKEAKTKTKSRASYRDVNLLITLTLPAEFKPNNKFLAEVQLNLPIILEAKDLHHPLYEIVRLKGAPIPAESVQDLANHVKITYDTLKDSHHLRSENLAVLKKLYECFETQGLYRGLTPRATTIPKDIASKLSPLISNIFEAYSDILIKRKLDGSLDPEQRRLASL